MLITGYADVKISLQAINEGSVFRMLTKPCDPQSFYSAIEDGLRQHELITSEKQLLDQTLKGAVQMLGDIMSVLDHRTFGRSQKLALASLAVGKALGVEKLWELEVAATLYEVGRATLPSNVAAKHLDSVNLTQAEERLLSVLPETSSRLLAHIPRLEPVANIILYQSKNFDGTGFPADGLRGEYLPLGARVLRVLIELQTQAEKDKDLAHVIDNLFHRQNHFDPGVLKACQGVLPLLGKIFAKHAPGRQSSSVWLKDLREGHRLASNIVSTDGILVISAGSIVSPTILQRIKNFAAIMPLSEPVEVIAD